MTRPQALGKKRFCPEPAVTRAQAVDNNGFAKSGGKTSKTFFFSIDSSSSHPVRNGSGTNTSKFGNPSSFSPVNNRRELYHSISYPKDHGSGKMSNTMDETNRHMSTKKTHSAAPPTQNLNAGMRRTLFRNRYKFSSPAHFAFHQQSNVGSNTVSSDFLSTTAAVNSSRYFDQKQEGCDNLHDLEHATASSAMC